MHTKDMQKCRKYKIYMQNMLGDILALVYKCNTLTLVFSFAKVLNIYYKMGPFPDS